MEKTVGINQRISITIIEMAMKASLDGIFTPEYAADLAAGEYQGENRIKKARSIIGKLTLRNPLFDYIKEQRQDYFAAIKYPGDRALVFSALINATYMFGYDAMCILGKLFHVQERVSTQVIVNRMSSIYASNRSLLIGLYCIMPMYIEAGLLSRPVTGIYTKNALDIKTEFARNIYKKSFFVNNPMLDEKFYECDENSYFEFWK